MIVEHANFELGKQAVGSEQIAELAVILRSSSSSASVMGGLILMDRSGDGAHSRKALT